MAQSFSFAVEGNIILEDVEEWTQILPYKFHYILIALVEVDEFQ
jgi:hypothetical protein